MKSAVLQSKDPNLLARMATDIKLHTGRHFDNTVIDPFSVFCYLHTWSLLNPGFYIKEQRLELDDVYRTTITEANYISVLTKILE